MVTKPWRVVEVGGDAGRLTREQVLEAVLAVKEEKEEARRLKGARAESRGGLRSRLMGTR